jgi:3-oxoacyl-[acyl-carrier-protein] synthase III
VSIKVRIDGLAAKKGTKKVSSCDLDKQLNQKSGSILKSTSLESRYFFQDYSEFESKINEAVNEALVQADITLDDINCIINASATMHQAIPYNAAYTHKILGCKKPIATFDINMTCLSSLRAFEVASHLLNSYKHILIISADFSSISLDFNDIKTAGIFADGTTAMIISKSTSGGILFSNFETHSSGYEYCQIKGGGSKSQKIHYQNNLDDVFYFNMDGKRLYKLTSQVLPSFILNTLKNNNLSLKDIDYIVPHQASGAALKHTSKALGFDESKFINIFAINGNQISSSIPSVLYHLFQTKDLQSGQKIMLVGTSAGLGLGLVVWEVP